MKIPVFFCEDTGFNLYSVHGKCACGLEMETQPIRLDYDPDYPSEYPDFCACGLRPIVAHTSSITILRRQDTGEELIHKTLPVGAVYEVSYRKGSDGRSLAVMTPGGTWLMDMRANNCDMPNDNEHRCWVRHGRPEDGTLHVDKVGRTCGAGAGSILLGSYHGFLHHGHLVEC